MLEQGVRRRCIASRSTSSWKRSFDSSGFRPSKKRGSSNSWFNRVMNLSSMHYPIYCTLYVPVVHAEQRTTTRWHALCVRSENRKWMECNEDIPPTVDHQTTVTWTTLCCTVDNTVSIHDIHCRCQDIFSTNREKSFFTKFVFSGTRSECISWSHSILVFFCSYYSYFPLFVMMMIDLYVNNISMDERHFA